MKIVIKRILIISILLMIGLTLFSVSFFYGTPYYLIVRVIYLTYSTTLIIFFFLILREFTKKSEVVKKYFKVVLFTGSILLAISTGSFYLWYLETFMVPDLAYCTYYDDYNYKLYAFESGCQEMTILDQRYNEENELDYLSYEIDDHHFKRYYANQRLTKTIETEYHVTILLGEDELPLLLDEQVIETTYEYQDNQYIQKRIITGYIQDTPVVTQNGFYVSKRLTENLNQDDLYHLNIQKKLSTMELLVSKSQLTTLLNTKDVNMMLNQRKINAEDYLNRLETFFTQNENMIDYETTQRVYKEGVYYRIISVIPYDPEPNHFKMWIKDKQIDAWVDMDRIYEYKDEENYIWLRYKNYVQTYQTLSIQRERDPSVHRLLHTNIFCDEAFEICNQGMGNSFRSTYIRNFIKTDQGVTKVEGYNLLDKNFLNDDRESKLVRLLYRNPKKEYVYLPFDHDINHSELFEQPQHFILLNENE